MSRLYKSNKNQLTVDERNGTINVSASAGRVNTLLNNSSESNQYMNSTPITFLHEQSNNSERYVLVVDDAPSNRKVVCRFLKLKGYITHEAEDGEKCLELIHSHYVEKNLCYDFIILDFEMPVLNGPSTARRIREKKEYIDLLIIGLTGNVLTEDIEFFLRSGVNSVHAKPVKIDALLEDVRRLQAMIKFV